MSAISSPSTMAQEFARRMSAPASPALEPREAMRRVLLDRTAAWLAARGCTRIALFGAGRHTRPLVRQPWLTHGIRVVAIIDDRPPAPVLAGIPLLTPQSVTKSLRIDAILISSECYEAPMYERALATLGHLGVPILRLYSYDDSPYESDHTILRLHSFEGLDETDAQWLVANRGERHDATLPMLPPARTELHLRRYELAADLLASRGPGHAADLACGTGYGASILSPCASSYVGVDIDPRTIEYATRRHGGPHRTFLAADARATSIPSGSIDLIASFETIEHIEDTAALVAEYRRVIAPRGTLVVSTPNRLGPTPYHVHDFGAAEFLNALEPTFRVTTLFGQLPIDDVSDPRWPPGLWPLDLNLARAGGLDTAAGKRPDFLIAIATPTTDAT